MFSGKQRRDGQDLRLDREPTHRPEHARRRARRRARSAGSGARGARDGARRVPGSYTCRRWSFAESWSSASPVPTASDSRPVTRSSRCHCSECCSATARGEPGRDRATAGRGGDQGRSTHARQADRAQTAAGETPARRNRAVAAGGAAEGDRRLLAHRRGREGRIHFPVRQRRRRLAPLPWFRRYPAALRRSVTFMDMKVIMGDES